MTIDDSTLAPLISLVRASSLSRLKTLSGRGQITLSEIEKEPLVFAHWMSFILVSGKTIRIVFKAHFMTEAARFFAAKTYRTSKEGVSQARALDFFKEFCNLTAGQLKIDLANSEVKSGVSLPGVTRGFDEIFYTRLKGSVRNYWRLNCEGESIDCSAHIEVFDHFVIKAPQTDQGAEQGDVEFL